jgi:hypothetical protein
MAYGGAKWRFTMFFWISLKQAMKKKQEKNEYVQVQNAWKNCIRASYFQTPYFSQFLFVLRD